MKPNLKILVIVLVIVLVLILAYYSYRAYIKMNISKKGIDFIRNVETAGKYYTTKFPDADGYSIGVGHFITPGEKFNGKDLMTATLTHKEIDQLFAQDIKKFVDAANKGIYVPVSQNEFDAVVSILFNIGKGWGDGIGDDATFIDLINSKAKNKDVAAAIMRFKYPSSIVGRRAKEARLFESGSYDMNLSSAELKHYSSLA